MYPVLVCINLSAMCLMLGGMVEVSLVEIPLFLRLPPEHFVDIHGILDRHIDRYMPAVTILAALSGLGEIVLSRYSGQRISALLGIVCLVVVMLISQFINVPLNRRIRNWKADALPANLLTFKSRWIRGHYLRTLAGALAFLALLLSALFYSVA